jgi:hypothetical protein
VNITVTEIDLETVGMAVTVEGEHIVTSFQSAESKLPGKTREESLGLSRRSTLERRPMRTIEVQDAIS